MIQEYDRINDGSGKPLSLLMSDFGRVVGRLVHLKFPAKAVKDHKEFILEVTKLPERSGTLRYRMPGVGAVYYNLKP